MLLEKLQLQVKIIIRWSDGLTFKRNYGKLSDRTDLILRI